MTSNYYLPKYVPTVTPNDLYLEDPKRRCWLCDTVMEFEVTNWSGPQATISFTCKNCGGHTVTSVRKL